MINKINGYVAITDPYAQHLVNQLKKDGHQLIAVLSGYTIGGIAKNTYRLDESKFEKILHADTPENYVKTVEYLEKLNVSSVLCGLDTGAPLWIKLINKLQDRPCPPLELSEILSNKYRTVEYLRKKGIAVARNTLINSLDNEYYVDSIESNINYPLIIKPTESAGSFGVSICSNRHELKKALEDIMGNIDVFGVVVQEAVAEELLVGQEYGVATVSYDGHHRIAGIFTYEEYLVDSVKFVRSIDLVDPTLPDVKEVINYALSILDATNYHQGQAYIEIILTKSGPRIVEFNARVTGLSGLLDVMLEKCTGNSQLALTSATCNKYTEDFNLSEDVYKKHKFGKIIFLKNENETKVETLNKLNSIESLKSFCTMKIKVSIGDTVPKTLDVISSPGIIVLANDCLQGLSSDINEIESLERDHIFLN